MNVKYVMSESPVIWHPGRQVKGKMHLLSRKLAAAKPWHIFFFLHVDSLLILKILVGPSLLPAPPELVSLCPLDCEEG